MNRGRDRLAARAAPRGTWASRSAILGAAAIAVLAAGCSALYQPPEVRLEGVRLVGLGLRGGTLEADVVVSNPNRYALRARHLSWDLDLAERGGDAPSWSPVATGRLDRDIELPARDSAVVGLPIDFRWDGVGGAIRALLESGTFDYRVSGVLELQSPLRRTVPYRHTGTISLDR